MTIANLIQREASRNAVRRAKPAVGLVDSYDPVTHSVKIKHDTEVDDQGAPRITGWIPIRCQAGGAGVSWVIGPSPGDQATIEYLEDDAEAGVCTGFLHNDVDQPPDAASSVAILRHTATGNYFTLNADGSFETFHNGSGNYTKSDVSGNLISHIKTAGNGFVYLGGDPNATPTPVFSPVATVAGPSPFVMGRIS